MIVLNKIKKIIYIYKTKGIKGVVNKIKSKAETYRLEKLIDRFGTKIRMAYTKICYGRRIKYGRGFVSRAGFTIRFNNFGTDRRYIKIGDGVFFNRNCSLTCYDSIEIGNNTIFGENVRIFDHNHRFNLSGVPISEQGYTYSPIKIGSNCWIGSNVVILKGVTVGNNCVIGAGVVLNQSIENDSLVTMDNRIKISKIRHKSQSVNVTRKLSGN